MNHNIGIGTAGTIAWDGAAAFPADITKWNQFGWSFQVTADIAVDAVFHVQAAPPSAADKCVPGAFADVLAVAICQLRNPVLPGDVATITIPAGTKAGTECAGTIPCRPNTFVRLAAISGDTPNVKAVLLRHGPQG